MTVKEIAYNLSGTVRHQGVAVAQATVSIFETSVEYLSPVSKAHSVNEQQTGQLGQFVFSVKPGTYRIEIYPRFGTRFLKKYVQDIVVAGNTACDVSLETGYLLSGKICNSEGQQIVDGALLAIGTEPHSYQDVSMIEDGSYTLVLSRGRYTLTYASQIETDRQNEMQSLSQLPQNIIEVSAPLVCPEAALVEIGGDTKYDINLPAMMQWEGTVQNEQGKPITKGAACIIAHLPWDENKLGQRPDISARCALDKNGRFKFLAGTGIYDLKIEAIQSKELTSLCNTNISIEDHCLETFILKKGTLVKGQVCIGDQVLPLCPMRFLDLKRNNLISMQADQHGRFTTTLLPGSYELMILGNDSNANILAPYSQIVEVKRDQLDLAIQMHPGVGVLVRVIGEAGKPKGDVRVSVFSGLHPSPKLELLSSSLTAGTTNSAGECLFSLLTGNYWLMLDCDIEKAKSIQIGDEPMIIEFDWTGWHQLHLEVSGEDGLPLSHCLVNYWPYTLDPGQAKKQANCHVAPGSGQRVIRGSQVATLNLPNGIYSFEFVPPRSGPYRSKTIRQLSLGADLRRKVTLPLKDGN